MSSVAGPRTVKKGVEFMNKNFNGSDIDNLYKTLPEEIAPTRDLWNDIDMYISDKKSSKLISLNMQFWGAGGAVAAVLVVVIGLGFFMMNGINNRSDVAYNNALKELESAAASYEKAKGTLIKLSMDRKSYMSNESLNSILKDVESIDKAVLSIKMAYKKKPDNHELLVYLGNVYYEETSILNKTTELLKNSNN